MKLSGKYFLQILFIFLLFVCAKSVFAETDIYGGEISQDTTWTADGSPYVIYFATDTDSGESDFTIDASTTLTIESGVIVKFDYGQSMNVLGNLVVNGTSDEKVYFTSLYDDSFGGDTDQDGGIIAPSDSDWIGIQVENGGQTELSNTDIYYAETALSFDSSTGQIDDTNIIDCQDGVDLYGGNVDLNNSNIEDLSGDGINAVNNSLVPLSFINKI